MRGLGVAVETDPGVDDKDRQDRSQAASRDPIAEGGDGRPCGESAAPSDESHGERRRFVLEDTGFDGVPARHRRFFRAWQGSHDHLGPNEVRCPRCGVVLRSYRDLREGDRLHCIPCDQRLRVTAAGIAEIAR